MFGHTRRLHPTIKELRTIAALSLDMQSKSTMVSTLVRRQLNGHQGSGVALGFFMMASTCSMLVLIFQNVPAWAGVMILAIMVMQLLVYVHQTQICPEFLFEVSEFLSKDARLITFFCQV